MEPISNSLKLALNFQRQQYTQTKKQRAKKKKKKKKNFLKQKP